MSARAAWRLESLGFTEVYRYTAGKADWFAMGLPREGTEAAIPRAGDVARRDVPVCQLTTTAGEARQHTLATGWNQCLVVNEHQIVLGRLRDKALETSSDTPVAMVMEPGPITIRPDERLEAVVTRLRQKHVHSIIVTRSDGSLIGVLVLDEAEQALRGLMETGRAAPPATP
jgi:CBS domain-containing protein